MAGERGLGQHCAVAGDADRRRPDGRRRQQPVGVLQGEEADQDVRIGAVQVRPRRPDLLDEEPGVAAEQVEGAQD